MDALGGAARLSQLRDAGYSRRYVDGAVARGELERVGAGRVVLPTAQREVRIAAMAAARVTCVTGLALLGLPVLHAPKRVHVATSNSRSYRAWGLDLRLHRIVGPVDIPVDVATMVRHASACLDDEALIVTLDGCVRRGFLTTAELAELDVVGRRRWRAVVDRCDPRSESAPETLARLALATLGVLVWPQADIPKVGRVDFLVEDRLVVEIDGRAHHAAPQEFATDRRRDRTLAERGFAVARFPASEVLRDAGAVARHCARRLDSARW